MAQKKSKSKISSVKRRNQLRTKLLKQGKLKIRRHRVKTRKVSKRIPQVLQNVDKDFSEPEDTEIMCIQEDMDMSFLQNAPLNESYYFSKNQEFFSDKKKVKNSKKLTRKDDELESFEMEYENSFQESIKSKKRKYLLPIKTSDGIVVRSEEDFEEEGDYEDNNEIKNDESEVIESRPAKLRDDEIKEVTVADLIAQRQNSLMKNKIKIGTLCSGITENPELNIKNFKSLLDMLSVSDPEVCITVKKFVIVSLLEVFKDLLPAYQIKHHEDPKVKLKKSVKQLYSYENFLIKYYKEYLKKIEKIVSILKKRKGDNRNFKEPEIKLAEVALKCFCELLTTHLYFNFSKNIVKLLVPFLNNGRVSVRSVVFSTIKEIFKSDKRGEMSYEVVRNINKYIKTKVSNVHPEMLLVCLALKLKDVNLDKEKQEEIKKKKEMVLKSKFMKMSKRERKRKKKFKELENELLETKAEENKKSKEHYLTEITKILFTIYFRILKVMPSSKLLHAALEGLVKFAHCINIEFYQDLIIVLGNLVEKENLKHEEKLCCVQTVFSVLFYQGATLNIDPIKFYSHFYANILHINAGKNHSELSAVLKTTDFVLLKRRKHVTLQRLLAFTKRLTALTLQVLPNGSLALLSVINQILQVNNSTDLLLDFDAGQGQGVYYPELDEPEYCNANATALWELILLQRHFHPTVQEYAAHLAKLGNKMQEVSRLKPFLKESPEQLLEEFNPTNVKFNPPVPPPKKFAKNKRGKGFLNEDLERLIKVSLQHEKKNFKSIFSNNKI